MKLNVKGLLLTVLLIGVSLSGCIQDLLPPPQTGNLYVLERGSDSVLSITPAGVISVLVPKADLLTLIGDPAGDLSFSDCGIVATQDGTLFFVLSSNDDGDYLIKRAANGTLSILADEADFDTAKGGGAPGPDIEGLAWGVDQMLYCVETMSDSLLKIDPDSGAVSVLVTGIAFDGLIAGSTFAAAPGITADEDYLYVCSDGTPDAVYRVSYAGVPEVFASGPGVDPTVLVPEIATIWLEASVTGGTFVIDIYPSADGPPTGFPMPWDTNAVDIQAAINAVFPGGVVVTGLGTELSPWILTFDTNLDYAGAYNSALIGGTLYAGIVQEAGQENVANHVEAIGTDATSGSFEIAIETVVVSESGPDYVILNVGDSAVAVKTALENQVDAIDPGDVTVTGTGTLVDPWVITFIGNLAKTKVDVELNENTTDGDVYVGTRIGANSFDDADGFMTRRKTGTLMMEDDSGAHFLYQITRAGDTSIFMSEWDIMIALDNSGEELDLEGGIAYDDDDNLFVGNNEVTYSKGGGGNVVGSAMIMRVAPNKTIIEWVTADDVVAVTAGDLEDVKFEGIAFERK